MQVLEKILQEIEERINDMASEARDCDEMEEYVEAETIDHTISGLNIASNIIRSHMGDDGWIPVEDRMPEAGQCVLITLKNLEVYSGFRSHVDGYFKVDSYGLIADKNVLAWMPLPAPYRKKGG